MLYLKLCRTSQHHPERVKRLGTTGESVINFSWCPALLNHDLTRPTPCEWHVRATLAVMSFYLAGLSVAGCLPRLTLRYRGKMKTRETRLVGGWNALLETTWAKHRRFCGYVYECAFSWAPRGHPGRFLPDGGIHITCKSSHCDLTCRCRERENLGTMVGRGSCGRVSI